MTTDSTRIWMKMSLGGGADRFANANFPTRSEMLASMMFMMPMPPTSRLMPAIIPPLSRALRMKVLIWFGPILLGAEVKSSIPLCVLISTLRICCSDSGSMSAS